MNDKVFLHGMQIVAIILAMAFCIGSTVDVNGNAEKVDPESRKLNDHVEILIIEEHEDKQMNAELPEITVEVKETDNGFEPHEIPLEYQQSGGSFPVELQSLAYQRCMETGVPYSLVWAVIEHESAYRNEAYRGCGVGYMQIVEKWHKNRMAKYGYGSLKEAEANIVVGIDYLAELLSQYDMEQALVVYNVGHPAAKSTAYSRAIMQRMKELEGEWS